MSKNNGQNADQSVTAEQSNINLIIYDRKWRLDLSNILLLCYNYQAVINPQSI